MAFYIVTFVIVPIIFATKTCAIIDSSSSQMLCQIL